jgi:hypothetical protein
MSLLRNRGLAAKDILLDLAGGCFRQLGLFGDVKSLKALHRYNVVKTPAVGVVTVWKWPAAFREGDTSGPCPSLFLAARVRSKFSAAP